MSEIPEGAMRSDDGYYWWDPETNAWQPVPQGSAAGQPSTAEQGDAAHGGELNITDASQMRPEHAVFAMTVTADDSQVLDVPPGREGEANDS
jgi:hypothetical protein